MKWSKGYELAKAYYEHHGNLELEANFKTINGYEYDEKGENLTLWVIAQRFSNNKNNLSEKHKKMLEEIGMIFENINDLKWQKMYNLAKIYYEHHGHLEAKSTFKTINGYEYDKKGENLGNWLRIQRQEYKSKKISKTRIEKLQKIGMVFEFLSETNWNKMYLLAKSYYEYYGNLNLQSNFKTLNGYEYDKKGENLSEWLRTQRFNYQNGNLSTDRINALIKIGFKFDNLHIQNWNKMYLLAKSYYEHYSNLKVPSTFKTINGYEYDEKGENLGYWINTQRRNYKNKKLSQEKIQKLEQINMIFQIIKNKQINQSLCESYNIDYDLFKNQIISIPHKEFQAKINYLIDHNLPIISNQTLNPIFFASNINLEVRYGINLEKLIEQYYVSKTKVKGL